jgi:hypothetical protein
MGSPRRLLFYLLLNVFVSACVTVTILFWYNRNYRQVTLPGVSNAPVAAVTSDATLQPDNSIPVEIVSVVGAGTLEAEAVLIHYSGDGQLDLTGWQLEDDNGNTFTFPALALFKNGSVQVHTATGTGTVVDLYWGQRQPVWQSGEVAKLYDPQGNLHAIYRVP